MTNKKHPWSLNDSEIIRLRELGINMGPTAKEKEAMQNYIKNNQEPCAVNYNLPAESNKCETCDSFNTIEYNAFFLPIRYCYACAKKYWGN